MRDDKAFTIEKTKFSILLNRFQEKYKVVGPTSRGMDATFNEIKNNNQLFLDYISTVLPPKKYFLPPTEELFSFKIKDKETDIFEIKKNEKILLLGIHPCDVNALLKLDTFFNGKYNDTYYQNRRKKTIIVALNCVEPSEYAFCNSMGTGPFLEKGFDLLLTDIGTRYLIEIGSNSGKKLLMELGLDEATDADFKEKNNRYKLREKKFKRTMNTSWLSKIAQENINHDIWNILSNRGGLKGSLPCLSCGSCSLVCPTCYCYDIYDTMDLSLNQGKRIRELDSCQLLEYGEVAQGGNFRRNRKDRVRHWMMCKFGAAAGGHHSSCVGCGRCIRACPVGIDITEVAKVIRGD